MAGKGYVVRADDGRFVMDIEVKPGSNAEGLTGFDPWRKRFVVQVKARARKGKANKALMKVVADALGVQDVIIESGHTSHSKTVSFQPGDNDEEGVRIILDGMNSKA